VLLPRETNGLLLVDQLRSGSGGADAAFLPGTMLNAR